MGVGAPRGNQNARGPRRNKEWYDALRKEVVQRDTLRKMAVFVTEQAEKGELWAIQEIGNRFDGKPAQAVEVSGPDGDPIELDVTSQELDARINELSAKLRAWSAD